MKRREFVTLLGGATVAWPLGARAQPGDAGGRISQQHCGRRPPPSYRGVSARPQRDRLREGRNLAIEYRYAENRLAQLEPLAADLIARKVGVIAAVGGNNSALVAKRLTSTIPILFTSGADPVKAGLVASINRPGANVTGVSWFSGELGSKHIELLNELVPQAELIAIMVNPNNPEAGFYEQSAQEGIREFGRRLLVVKAGTTREIDAAFATLVSQRANAVMIASDPFYPGRARQLAVLAARHAIPMIAAVREITAAGGLISYGNSVTDAYRRVGVYAGRILRGAKPADMPVDRATKFELVINLGTAKALDIEIPPNLLAIADEVI